MWPSRLTTTPGLYGGGGGGGGVAAAAAGGGGGKSVVVRECVCVSFCLHFSWPHSLCVSVCLFILSLSLSLCCRNWSSCFIKPIRSVHHPGLVYPFILNDTNPISNSKILDSKHSF